MTAPLTLRRVDPELESFATLYTHPEFGKIDVGRISRRVGNPDQSNAWSWCIRSGVRPGLSFAAESTAPTMKAAIAAWKAAWPKFRDARTDAEWHDIKADQDWSQKKIMIIDALKLRITDAQRAELQVEMGRTTPAPRWLVELLQNRT
jgi:hypothetical protein